MKTFMIAGLVVLFLGATKITAEPYDSIGWLQPRDYMVQSVEYAEMSAFCLAKADGSRPKDLAHLLNAMKVNDEEAYWAIMFDTTSVCADGRINKIGPVTVWVEETYESLVMGGYCVIIVLFSDVNGVLGYGWLPCRGVEV